VDDAVDETRDGIYVSRETVRTHPSDRAVPEAESAQQPVGDASATDVDPVDEVTTSIDAVHADPDVEESLDATDDVDEDVLVPVPGTTFGEIDLDLIRPNPRQPRDVFDEDALDELVTSIREIGVLQPVVVRRRPDLPGHYELIMGERRYRASKEAGRTTIPAIVRATADDDLLRDALLENLHRVDLNPLEEAAAYAQLLEDFNCTQEELSERIGRSRPQISNTIRLLKLPAMVQRRVAAGVLSSGHARALLGLNDGADMEQLAQRVVAEGLSVRATEEAVLLLNRGDRIAVSRGTREADPELAELARNLGDRLETRVNVVMGKRKGKLSVEFANGEDLARILSLLGLDASEQ
jgi:ParB family chromosome partitioning protein